MSGTEHSLRLRIGSKFIERWDSYSVDMDMMQPADAFTVTFAPKRRDVWALCAPDAEVQILADDVVILSGFIDEREASTEGGGSGITVTGRDRGGRLVDESMPLLTFTGLTVQQLAERCVDPWFSRVTLSNAENRKLTRGGGKQAKTAGEPAILQDGRSRKKVDPGETRWQVLEFFLREAELLAWSSANGKDFVVGLPNYNQEPQYRLFLPAEGSRRQREGNVLGAKLQDSVAERYARIVACGSGRGNSADYSERVVKRRGIARNGPSADGTGKDFAHPKNLLIAHDDVRTVELAEKRAEREMAIRDAGARTLQVTVQGHGQIYAGAPVLFAFDTMAEFEDEELGIAGRFLITKVTMAGSGSGRTTSLTLVPRGTRLMS